ncbi:BZIP transcription factor AtfA-like protein [Penicillium ucsense]|uniref:BZIP transcription factor AtfA-like protein n=1 Tax=Penicillium ucsense TaxID=2839758 RepID=A0A8J8VZJ0_9EURO|nr:BZIP transcription factor AtfA-like protein [Penicillium ucsense]KAF7734633.1 BZIP transcription factor AtfA-like protein [Penicillium ucsense]
MSAAVAPSVSTLSNTLTSMDSKKIAREDSQVVSSDAKEQRSDVDASTSLAPPPRPATTTASDTPDYFNSVHNPFSLEPNPFEQSFGTGNSAETPGKSLLPPVAALTSPALPGASSGGGYNWSNSLRSGPLSPAMLPGPTGSNDYFDSIGRGFPTPNESSLRTGLTPGGGGSMFPAPSPNSQALLQQLQSGGATPSTIEFHRTALAAKKNSGNGSNSNANESEPTSHPAMDTKLQPTSTDFTQHDAADAANGLFMLAKGGQANNMPMNQVSNAHHDSRSSAARRVSQNTNGGPSREMSGEASEDPSKPASKGKGKKSAPKATPANNRRKTDEPTKGPNKKIKMSETPSDDSEDEEMRNSNMDPKKMTDEEKRRNFLERNRVAALKCRQRKKQWLANLQAKVELFTTENDALTATVTQLREEIVNLKTLLLAHKDCPVSQAQGLGPLMMNGMATGFDPHGYGMPGQMGMPPGGPIPAQGMRRA